MAGRTLNTGRFSTGMERTPDPTHSWRIGRYSDGLATTTEGVRQGRFSDGMESLADYPVNARVGTFADGYGDEARVVASPERAEALA
jgi:hypothetical protein